MFDKSKYKRLNYLKMTDILPFYVQSDYNFQNAMHRLYTTIDPLVKKSGRMPNCMIQLTCGHFVPSLIISESISPKSISSQLFNQCECNDEGCAMCTETMCVFICSLCNVAITPIASLHVVQMNDVSNWISTGPRKPTYGDGYGDGSFEEIVRKRKCTSIEKKCSYKRI